MDPVWQELERLQLEITDKRSLIDKIEAVAKDYPKNKFQHLARKACRSKKEQSDSNKTVLSLKYRVFEACNDYFFENDRKPNLTVNEVDSLFSDLFNESVESIDELKKDYNSEKIKDMFSVIERTDLLKKVKMEMTKKKTPQPMELTHHLQFLINTDHMADCTENIVKVAPIFHYNEKMTMMMMTD